MRWPIKDFKVSRRPNIIRPIKLNTTFPEDIRAKLELHLFSTVEQRVPKGAIQKFLCERITEFFSQKRVYLQSDEITLVRHALLHAQASLWNELGAEEHLKVQRLLETLK
jgi:hypothetical protein